MPIEEFTFNKSGPRKGKPLSRCKKCRSLAKTSTVPYSSFMPFLEKLLSEYSFQQAAAISELRPEHLRELYQGKRKRIYKKTFLKIFRAVSSLPKHKESIGPKVVKTKREETLKLSYEERLGLRYLISKAQKKRYEKDKLLLKKIIQ